MTQWNYCCSALASAFAIPDVETPSCSAVSARESPRRIARCPRGRCSVISVFCRRPTPVFFLELLGTHPASPLVGSPPRGPFTRRRPRRGPRPPPGAGSRRSIPPRPSRRRPGPRALGASGGPLAADLAAPGKITLLGGASAPRTPTSRESAHSPSTARVPVGAPQHPVSPPHVAAGPRPATQGVARVRCPR